MQEHTQGVGWADHYSFSLLASLKTDTILGYLAHWPSHKTLTRHGVFEDSDQNWAWYLRYFGTSAPIIGRYERNEIEPSLEIAKTSDELSVTVDYVLGGSDKMMLDKKNVKRMEEIENLPDKEKENSLSISISLPVMLKSKISCGLT